MHSDRCRLQGRTINQWLAEPGAMAGFLEALQAQGWIKRDSDPMQSRFWSLIDGPGAAMFGVFSAYEKQLWHDWIAGSWQGAGPRRVPPGQWEQALALQAGAPGQARASEIATLIEAMAGNRYAEPTGLRATRDYIAATGLFQGGPQ